MQKQLLAPVTAGMKGFARRLQIGLKTSTLAASLLAAGTLFSATGAQAQTTLLNEGFESGLNGWTLVNGTQTNKWFVGTATASAGTQSAYVSNDAGVTNAYDNVATSVVHLYKDVVIPATQKNITLTFKWRALGEGGTTNDYDNLKVYLTNPATPITAGAELPVTEKIGAAWYNASSATAYSTATIQIPNSYSGMTKRLVFSWKNDETAGSQPPASVDEIMFTSVTATPMSGVYTINNTQPTGGTNFTSFTDAFNAINNEGVSGPVTFNVSAGQSFAENNLILSNSGTAANPVIFQKSGTGANPMIRPTGTTASNEAGVTLNGADFTTFDGIDINIASVSALEYGYLIRNASATDGAINNTIRNASITLNKAITGSIAVLQTTSSSFGGGVTPVSVNGTNQNNTYNNLAIQSVYNGILLVSASSTFSDENNTVSGNTIGGTTTTEMAGGTTTAYGIKATLQTDVNIFENQVRNITTTTAAIDGIFLDQGIGLSEIYNNKINGLALSTATGTAVITGMRINTHTSTNGNVTRVYNNFVSGLSHPFVGTATATRRIIGIFVQSNGAGVSNTQNIDFNSVRIDPAAAYTASTTAFEIGTTSGPVINVRNNIFANFQGAQTGVAKHYTWVTTAANATGIAGSVSDYNLLYIANTGNGFIGLTGTADQATMNSWRNATNQDLNSKSSNPQFVSVTDLHISPTTPTEVESGGSFFNGAITWANNDIDGNARNATKPDIGGDEGAFVMADFTGPVITMGPLLTNTTSTANRTVTATITDMTGVPTTGNLVPRLYFSKGGAVGSFVSTPGVLTAGTATNGTWTFTLDNSLIGGITNGAPIFYFIAAQDVNGNTSTNPVGNSVITDVNTVSNITVAYLYYVSAGISGTITVPGTYPSLTLAGGLFEAINQGVVTGNLNVNITADLTAETGLNGLSQWVEEGTGNYTMVIRPDAAANRTISGTGTAGLGLIRMTGADRVTIDGSFNGTGHYLTIINNGTVASTLTLQAVNGALNNTFRNLNLSTGSNTVSNWAFVSNGLSNDNLLFENNVITKAYTGISIQNAVTSPIIGLQIRDNIIGSQVAGEQVAVRGISMTNATAPVVTRNNISLQTAVSAIQAGIELGTNVTNASVSKNIISGVKTTASVAATGIYISSNVGVENNTIDNNMISDILAPGVASSISGPIGIRIDGGSNTKIYFNSVNMTGALTVTGAGRSAALYVNSSAVTGLDVRNNIFANSMTGSATSKSYAVYAISGVTFGTINYNNYFVDGANAVFGFLGSDVATLAAWRTATGQDANSVSVDPQFISATDLHVTTANLAMNNLGTPIAGVTTDIDNDARNATTPDIGADEFSPASLDLGAFALASPSITNCYGANEPVTVTIKNLGITPINFAATNATVTVTATVPTGAPAATFAVVTLNSNVLNGGNPLAVGATLDVPVGTINMSTPGTYTFNATTNVTSGGTDGNTTNDAMDPVAITVVPVSAGTASATQTNLCQSGTTTLNVTGNAGGATQWQVGTSATGPFTDISGATGNSFTLTSPITATTYYQAVTTCGTNTATSNVVTVTVNNPTLVSSNGATRCGAGVVNLTATASTGSTLTWFDAATGGTPLATGTSYSPTVTTTSTYYVEASVGSNNYSVGATSNAIGAGGATGTTLYYQIFDVLSPLTLQSVYVYPAAAGNVVLHLSDNAGTIIQVITVPVTATDVNQKTLIPINVSLPAGTGYRLGWHTGGVNLYRNTAGATYPYTVPGVISITGSSFVGFPQYWYYVYDFQVSVGCASSRMPVTATVNPLPVVALGTDIVQCGTAAVTLDAGATTGATYQWSLNGTAIPGATSQTYAATASGTYSVTVTNTATTCAGTDDIVVTMGSAPATPTVTAAGATTFCTGGSVALTAASTTPGATYQWFNGVIAITGATSATYAANASGAYTVVATANGCPSTASAPTVVIVNTVAATPTVTAAGPTTFCTGGSVALTAASATPTATYQWFNGTTAIAGATSATYTANAAGSYTAVATANGCPSPASTATTVIINAIPATPTVTQNGGILTSSAATGNQWYLNGTIIPGATGQVYTTAANGNYTVVTTANGCSSAPSLVLNVTTSGMADALAGMSIQVYPNPTKGSFNVKLNGYQKGAAVSLFNLAGQLIATDKVAADGKARNIDIKGLSAGTYLLKVTSDKGVQVNRLIVQ